MYVHQGRPNMVSFADNERAQLLDKRSGYRQALHYSNENIGCRLENDRLIYIDLITSSSLRQFKGSANQCRLASTARRVAPQGTCMRYC